MLSHKVLLLCIQNSGCGLIRYLICVAPHTLVIQCQFKNKKVLSLGILNDLYIFYHSTTNSPFSLLNSSYFNHLITLHAYLRSITPPYLSYRGCWHRLWPGLLEFRLIMVSKFLANLIAFIDWVKLSFIAQYSSLLPQGNSLYYKFSYYVLYFSNFCGFMLRITGMILLIIYLNLQLHYP